MTDTEWYNSSSDLAAVKQELRFKSTDTSEDALLNGYGDVANRKIDNTLYPYKDRIPEIDDEITEDLKEAAVFIICRRYKIFQKNYDAAKEYKQQYDEIMETVIQRLQAIPEGRTDTVVYSHRYRSEPLRTRTRYFGD